MEKIWYRMGKEFAAQGHELVHIGKAHPDLSDSEESAGVQYLRIRGYETPASLLKLKWLDLLYSVRAVRKIPPDVDIIVTNTFWAPLLLRGKLGKKVYVSVERFPKGQMWMYKQASRLRANSNAVADAIRRELPAGEHHRVVVIPNPLPFQRLPPIDPADKKPVLLYVGRVHPEKGLELLINAFRALKTDWTLRIVGPADFAAGGGGNAYLASLRQLAGPANVDFTGPVYDPVQLNQFYAEASVFVYPSVAEQGETFGLAPLEAMAWGCVPIVSALACFRDFINHEENGLIFDHRSSLSIRLLKDAIERLQQDASFRSALAQRALAVRQTHSITSVASQFIHEFERVIDERRLPETAIL